MTTGRLPRTTDEGPPFGAGNPTPPPPARAGSENDRRLIAECLGGRREAFGELVTRYQERLYNAVFRLSDSPEDAADVVQDTFLTAFQSLYTFKGDSEFFTWLYRIAFNTAISLRRKERAAVRLCARQQRDHPREASDQSDFADPGVALEQAEEEGMLHAALGRLSEDHREVLVLKDIEGLQYKRIAVVLGAPVGTVRSRIHRARLELRDILDTRVPEGAPSAGEDGIRRR